MSGVPVFTGTRIPVLTLFENLKAGATVDEFLEWFPGSDRAQVELVLDFVSGRHSCRSGVKILFDQGTPYP